jgi:hypothetical protein
MAGLVFHRDGVVAGYEDIVKDPSLIDVDRSRATWSGSSGERKRRFLKR